MNHRPETDDSQADMRLDIYVQSRLPNLSRAYIQKLITQQRIRVNGVPEKPGYKLRAQDRVIIDYDPSELEAIPHHELPILYEDEDCLVIDKPTGILSHSKGAFNPEATVATFISSRIQDLQGDRAGIVHRLDRATSGVIICAKHPVAFSWLQKQFSQRRVGKTYNAIVQGHVDHEEAVIDMPIERHPQKPKIFRAGAGGKQAITRYKVVQRNKTHDMLALFPTTGRTHQLRVHLKQLGHPIVGDTLYGGEEANRLFLHALSLEITLPNHTRRTFVAPLPQAFTVFMKSTSLHG